MDLDFGIVLERNLHILAEILQTDWDIWGHSAEL